MVEICQSNTLKRDTSMKNIRDISRRRQRIEIEKEIGRGSKNSKSNSNNARDSLNNSNNSETEKENGIMISKDRDMRCMSEEFDLVILVIHSLDTMRIVEGVERTVEVQVVLQVDLQDPCLRINIDMEPLLHHLQDTTTPREDIQINK